MPRKFPRKLKRIVIKIGSRGVVNENFLPRSRWLGSLAAQIKQATSEGIEIVLVSSGAIALGLGVTGLKSCQGDMASLQALAAIGQTVLMRTYDKLFKKKGLRCAQVLLTWDDFSDRPHKNNAKKTLDAILKRGVVPIINENDTVSTDEIRFGDNDKLSAFVATLVQADLLLILSDVEGLYDPKQKGRKIFREVKQITPEIVDLANGPVKGGISRGGMTAKLESIGIAVDAKVPCLIASNRTRNVLARVLKKELIGTFFVEKEKKLRAKKHWIAFVAKPRGSLRIDEGAKNVLRKGGKSLLLPGILDGGWEGHFKKNDVVILQDKSGREIGRGIINYSLVDLMNAFTSGNKKGKMEVIHCDNLILSEKSEG